MFTHEQPYKDICFLVSDFGEIPRETHLSLCVECSGNNSSQNKDWGMIHGHSPRKLLEKSAVTMINLKSHTQKL